MAAVDAVYNLKSELMDEISQKLLLIKADIDKRKVVEIGKILETKVNFETLYSRR